MEEELQEYFPIDVSNIIINYAINDNIVGLLMDELGYDTEEKMIRSINSTYQPSYIHSIIDVLNPKLHHMSDVFIPLDEMEYDHIMWYSGLYMYDRYLLIITIGQFDYFDNLETEIGTIKIYYINDDNKLFNILMKQGLEKLKEIYAFFTNYCEYKNDYDNNYENDKIKYSKKYVDYCFDNYEI